MKCKGTIYLSVINIIHYKAYLTDQWTTNETNGEILNQSKLNREDEIKSTGQLNVLSGKFAYLYTITIHSNVKGNTNVVVKRLFRQVIKIIVKYYRFKNPSSFCYKSAKISL